MIVAACLEHAGVWAMWTYYGAFYVQQHAFSTQQVGWVSLAAGLGVLLGQTAAGGRLGEPVQDASFSSGASAQGRSLASH